MQLFEPLSEVLKTKNNAAVVVQPLCTHILFLGGGEGGVLASSSQPHALKITTAEFL